MKYFKKTLALILAFTFGALPTFSYANFQRNASSDISGGTNSENNENNENVNPEEIPDLPADEEEPLPPEENTPDAEEPPAIQETLALYIRCTSSVNIRSGAGTNYSILGTAETNSNYAVIEKIGNWYKTYYKGKTAYIYSDYTFVFSIEESENSTVEKVLLEGYKLLGTPYVYGAVRLHNGSGKFLSGFTASKFDCSSLTQYIYYYGAGKLLQTTTRTQVVQGSYVSRSSLQRGDCIYFTNDSRYNNVGTARVGHVAVYLGNDYILHTSSDYARIEKMSTTRWKYYIESRRFT